MTAACDAGDAVACDELSREEEAKRAWLARLEVPTWGPKAMSEEEAKKAWLARLDVPSWGEAPAQTADMTAACEAGDAVACDELSREEEAKRAWLARLEVPTWGPKAMSEEEAKNPSFQRIPLEAMRADSKAPTRSQEL